MMTTLKETIMNLHPARATMRIATVHAAQGVTRSTLKLRTSRPYARSEVTSASFPDESMGSVMLEYGFMDKPPYLRQPR